MIGLGVAGNFTGHLEQAGEADDFKDLVIQDANAPKGVFPFYVPGDGDHFLHTFPVSSDTIRLGSDDENHQIEPEVSLLCDLEYEGDRVVAVVPRRAMAHNDCSIRREGAKKISEKKNWGPTKGTARVHRDRPLRSRRDPRPLPHRLVPPAGRNALRLRRRLSRLELQLHVRPPARLARHEAERTDRRGPLENIAEWLRIGGRPSQALISIGATRYTEFGETTFLARGDQSIVIVYDARRFDAEGIRAIAREEAEAPTEGLAVLRQDVI